MQSLFGQLRKNDTLICDEQEAAGADKNAIVWLGQLAEVDEQDGGSLVDGHALVEEVGQP